MTPEQFRELPVGSVVRARFEEDNVDYEGFWVLINEPYTIEGSVPRQRGYRDLMMIAGTDDLYEIGGVFASVYEDCRFVELVLELYEL